MAKIASSLTSRTFRNLITPDRLAVLISLLGILVSYLVTDRVFERMPHIEDEVAYVWQARVFSHGQLTIPTPPHPKSYLVPFVVDFHGQRFGKYPPGWPALLAVAVKLGMRSWLNPLLAGVGVWLTYLLGKRFFSQAVGLLAAGLTVTSPFFLMNSGSLLSHPLGLVLSATFALAWLEMVKPRQQGRAGRTPCDHTVHRLDEAVPNGQIRPVQNTGGPVQNTGGPVQNTGGAASTLYWLIAGVSLGMLVITRPFTAVALAVPFGLHGLYLLVRGSWAVRRRVLAVGMITLTFAGVYFGWQKAVTGSARTNPYELWWPYDKIGFGVGYGVLEEGHNYRQALTNTRRSLASGAYDLFGWGALSWIFIPYGLWAITFGEGAGSRTPSHSGIRNRQAWMLFSAVVCLVIAYMAYWIGSELFGPRYYYEGLFSLTLLSGAGIAFLAGWRVNPEVGEQRGAGLPQPDPAQPGDDRENHSIQPLLQRLRAPAVMLLVAGLVGYNLAVYLPGRMKEMHGLYGSNRQIINNFLQAQVHAEDSSQVETAADITPALIIVHSDTWHFYGALLELEDPYMTTPYVFAWSMHPTTDAVLHNDFPFRRVFHYYEDEPGVLYTRPRPE